MKGVTDEQRLEAFRDQYGRVAFAASWQTLGQVPPAWEGLPNYTRSLWGAVAEAVIDAFMSGVVLNDQDLADEKAQERRWRVE